jgi:hypothetical protein
MLNFYLILIGLFAGFLCGLLGIGGGTIVIPALLFLFNFEMKKAIGTSLVLVTFASLMGVIGHYQLHNINWKFGMFMTLGSIAGVFLGVHLNQVVPNLMLKKIFGFFLLLVSIKLITAP